MVYEVQQNSKNSNGFVLSVLLYYYNFNSPKYPWSEMLICTLCIMLPGIHSFACRNLFHFYSCTEGWETESLPNPGNKKRKRIILEIFFFCRYSVQNIKLLNVRFTLCYIMHNVRLYIAEVRSHTAMWDNRMSTNWVVYGEMSVLNNNAKFRRIKWSCKNILCI